MLQIKRDLREIAANAWSLFKHSLTEQNVDLFIDVIIWPEYIYKQYKHHGEEIGGRHKWDTIGLEVDHHWGWVMNSGFHHTIQDLCMGSTFSILKKREKQATNNVYKLSACKYL